MAKRIPKLYAYYMKLTRSERNYRAEKLQITPEYLNHVIHGVRQPSPHLARRIYDDSDGAIPLSAMRPELWPPNANLSKTVKGKSTA
jgi:DNA-binding transcriptional regulator YdaS (Cro superfamily)